jgi:integrase
VALNEKALRALKPREKPFKVSDERSFYLLVSPTGALCWRLKYRFTGTEKVLALGTYSDVPLKDSSAQARCSATPLLPGEPSVIRLPISKARWLRLSFAVIPRSRIRRESRSYHGVIYGYTGQPATEAACKLAPLVFVRPGELRKAQWSEVDLANGEWRIPAHKMKLLEQHIVPLAKQAIAIFRELELELELEPVTGSGHYVFPCTCGEDRPMSVNALTAALRRMGYGGDQMTWHGFRSLASTQLNEQGFEPDWVAAQLARAERNDVRAAYNDAKYLPQRRKMRLGRTTWIRYAQSDHHSSETNGMNDGKPGSVRLTKTHSRKRRPPRLTSKHC